jgi:hypothetical protein
MWKCQVRKLNSGPSPATRIKLLSFNKTQTKVINGLLTEHNTLGRHLNLTGLTNSCFCGRCGLEEETSAHACCECEALVLLRLGYFGSIFLNPEDFKNLSLGAIWDFSKGTGLHDLASDYGAQMVRLNA